MLKRLFTTLTLSAASIASACGAFRGVDPDPRQAHSPESSIGRTERTLYGLVQSLDAWGREAGHLPNADIALVARARDDWNRDILYRSAGLRFELRSSGPDHVLDTSDDIVATGQVGRDRPCELRNGTRVERWEEFAPPCSSDAPVVVLPHCPSLLRADLATPNVGPTGDSVAVVGTQLVGIARRIDGASRRVGGLVPTLRIPGAEPVGEWGFWDIWRNRIQYVREGSTFIVRSVGSDRLIGTEDDITVRGVLGEPVRCEYLTRGMFRVCELPPPPC